MQSFLQFLQIRSDLASAGSFCFVTRESQALLGDFIRRVILKSGQGNVVCSDLAQEIQTLAYDTTAQLGLFAGDAVLQAKKNCWLSDLFATETYLTSQQKMTLLKKLRDLIEKNATSRYFFELDARDVETHKALLNEIENVHLIKISDSISFEEFAAMADFFERSASVSLQEAYGLRPSMSLDHAIIILEHISCVSRRTFGSFERYLFGLFPSSVQLRDLSEAFWTRNSKKFFTDWERMADEYPDGFWVSYWSTQLFTAFFFIDRSLREGKVTPVGAEHGLSPTFTWKLGWKKYSKAYCVELHDRLYEVDCELKNGSDQTALENFFSGHFLNK